MATVLRRVFIVCLAAAVAAGPDSALARAPAPLAPAAAATQSVYQHQALTIAVAFAGQSLLTIGWKARRILGTERGSATLHSSLWMTSGVLLWAVVYLTGPILPQIIVWILTGLSFWFLSNSIYLLPRKSLLRRAPSRIHLVILQAIVLLGIPLSLLEYALPRPLFLQHLLSPQSQRIFERYGAVIRDGISAKQAQLLQAQIAPLPPGAVAELTIRILPRWVTSLFNRQKTYLPTKGGSLAIASDLPPHEMVQAFHVGVGYFQFSRLPNEMQHKLEMHYRGHAWEFAMLGGETGEPADASVGGLGSQLSPAARAFAAVNAAWTRHPSLLFNPQVRRRAVLKEFIEADARYVFAYSQDGRRLLRLYPDQELLQTLPDYVSIPYVNVDLPSNARYNILARLYETRVLKLFKQIVHPPLYGRLLPSPSDRSLSYSS